MNGKKRVKMMDKENWRIPLDFKICVVIFLISVLLFIESRRYADKAAMFPSIMLVCIMILSTYIMVKSYLYERNNRQMINPGIRKGGNPPDLKAVIIFGGMTALYAFFACFTGFALSSLLFLYVGAYFFGERGKLGLISVSVVTMLFVYAFFIRFLDVGIPFFPEFS